MNDRELIWEAYQNSSEEDPMNRIMFPDSKRKETIGEFIKRHELPMENGYIILYHAVPKKIKLIGNVIRAWSYYAKDPEQSLHFAGRDRDLNPSSLKLYKVHILPQELEYCGHYQSNVDIPLAQRAELIKT